MAAIVGAKDFLASGDNHETLVFKFKGCKHTNAVRITLNAMDTYDVEFLKINARKLTCETVESVEGVYNDMLQDVFESFTGLYLTL